jgi:hypothetical protein
MNVRDALKADYGIDVRIGSGTGVRNDPFVIEPCTTAEAVRTQIDLLRGLGRGRRELWRLLRVEPFNGLQRLVFDAIWFTETEIISETRSLFFDLGAVAGIPDANAPVVEWFDPRSPFVAVSQIGWLHFDRAVYNSETREELDTSLCYSAHNAIANIYIYE